MTWIFKGDYNIEKNLPQETSPISSVFGLDNECGPDCRANSFALAGYIEAYQATNGFENAMRRWNEIKATTPDFYASSTGHGLGGMHSVSSLSFSKQRIADKAGNYPPRFVYCAFSSPAGTELKVLSNLLHSLDPRYCSSWIPRRRHFQVSKLPTDSFK